MNCGIRPQAKKETDLPQLTQNLQRLSLQTVCGANESGQRILTTHIWQEYLDLVEHLRKTERGKELYAMRKETIERVFADAKKSTPCGIRTTEVWPGFLLG
ncbi:MAG: transposase [Oscillospiraceae bacterium]